VVVWLRGLGFETYHEVAGIPGRGASRADIVAVREGRVWVVECKLRLSWDAIGQAIEWRHYAHRVSVATALGPHGIGHGAACACLNAVGLGWLRVSCGEVFVETSAERPRFGRVGLLLDALRPEQQASAPGQASTAGGYWTPGDEARSRIAAAVAAEPGVLVRRALQQAGIVCPDAATRREWRAALLRGLVDGVRAEREGRTLRLWPAEGTF